MIPIPDSSRPSAMQLAQASRHPVPRRLRQEPLHRPHLHHARPGDAQEVGAPEAQRHRPGIQGQERAAGRRFHRARHHQPRDRRDGARGRRAKVYFASAAPPVRFPNVYGIDMPTRAELIATGRTDEEIAREIGADALIYQDLDALQGGRCTRQSVRSTDFDTSCFDGQLHHRRCHAGIPRQRRDVAAAKRSHRRRWRPSSST